MDAGHLAMLAAAAAVEEDCVNASLRHARQFVGPTAGFESVLFPLVDFDVVHEEPHRTHAHTHV